MRLLFVGVHSLVPPQSCEQVRRLYKVAEEKIGQESAPDKVEATIGYDLLKWCPMIEWHLDRSIHSV